MIKKYLGVTAVIDGLFGYMGSDSVSDWVKPGMNSNPELNVWSGEL